MGLVLAVSGSSAYILFTRQLWNRLDTALVEEADTSTLAFAHGGLERGEEIGRQLAREHDRPKRRVCVWRDGCLLGDFGEGDPDLPQHPFRTSAGMSMMAGFDMRLFLLRCRNGPL